MEATGKAVGNVLGTNGENQRETDVQNGLATPGGTPAVDNARVEADKARQAAEGAANTSANGSTETEDPHSGDGSDSDLSEYETDSDGDIVPVLPEDGMDDVTGNDGIPWPTSFIQKVYQEATPHLAKLILNPTDVTAMGALYTLNDKIKQQNEKDEIQPDQWTIDWTYYGSHFERAKPYMDRVLKRGEGEPIDEESVKKLDEINATLREINTKHHYPEDWVINPPSEEVESREESREES
ncbi:hypothetical protein BDZ45DRAFT_739054 [Acephala macrosclerotiorum]|nr:hypothetical protein BDZ45DRAFT_739054 [Acephala macrosclerotiorum]